MTSNEDMIKALRDFEPRIINTRKPKRPKIGKLGKITLYFYGLLFAFALGQFLHFDSDFGGVSFYIDGLGGYYWNWGVE